MCVGLDLEISSQTNSARSPTQSDSQKVQTLRTEVERLLASISSHATDMAELQRAKSSALSRAEEYHIRLTAITSEQSSMLNSYQKRLEEKNRMVERWVRTEREITELRDVNTVHLQALAAKQIQIHELQRKAEEQEARISRLESENDDLKQALQTLQENLEEGESVGSKKRPRHTYTGLAIDSPYESRPGYPNRDGNYHDPREGYRNAPNRYVARRGSPFNTYPVRRHDQREHSDRASRRGSYQHFEGPSLPDRSPEL